ncbi:MAG TPA: DUF6766 family protein [Aestuariivirga sp.]|nr:DUF6766 family protein [Aestuariivirga sp.]
MKLFRDNGLTIVLLLMFAFSLGGMALTGLAAFNAEQLEHGGRAISLAEFLLSSRFISVTFENWESEFLQMATYVILTAYMFQRGSAESRDPDSPDRPKDAATTVSWLYAHSLGLALIALFVISLVLHWLASASDAAHEAVLHGQTAGGVLDHLGEPQFWFESFQNWQSEFLSTAVLVVLSIFLRYKGSPESKPVLARNSETGA